MRPGSAVPGVLLLTRSGFWFLGQLDSSHIASSKLSIQFQNMPATQGAFPNAVAGLRMRSVPSQPGADKGSTTAMRPANSDQSYAFAVVAASIEFILATIQRASEFTGSITASNHYHRCRGVTWQGIDDLFRSI